MFACGNAMVIAVLTYFKILNNLGGVSRIVIPMRDFL